MERHNCLEVKRSLHLKCQRVRESNMSRYFTLLFPQGESASSECEITVLEQGCLAEPLSECHTVLPSNTECLTVELILSRTLF